MTDDVTDHPIDYRVHPDAYRVGRGEEGVFHVQPYKGELLPLWRFATMPEAEASIAALREKFAAYRAAGDFVGMDMTRKYLQMGYTRARRYAIHRTGRKRDADGNSLPLATDPRRPQSPPASTPRGARSRRTRSTGDSRVGDRQ